MTLEAPLFLLALLLLPAGWFAIRAAQARRKRHAIRMPAVATLRAVVAAQPSYRRWLPAALLGLAVALMAFALTRPEVTVSKPVERATVMLVTDASGSMNATDVQPTRMDAAKNAAKTFVDGVPKQTRVGLVGYSTSPSTVQEPTTDRDVLTRVLDGLQANGGTATGDALSVALDAVQAEGDPAKNAGQKPPGAILLLSDGASDPATLDPRDVARQAKQANVPIYTVALGTPDGVVTNGFGRPTPVPPDPQTMREIAQISGGQSFTVDDADRLDEIYQQVGARVASEAEQREITSAFAGGALVALVIALGFGLRWRGRVA
jgi:Ca-activated chloride channel family protein